MPDAAGDAPDTGDLPLTEDGAAALLDEISSPIGLPPAPAGPIRYYELDWRTVLFVIGVFAGAALLWSMVVNLSATFTSVVVASFLALALNPLVGWLERRLRLSRGIALAVSLLTILIVLVLGVLAFGQKAVEQAESIQTQLPDVLQEMTRLPVVGQTLADNGVPAKAQQWLSDLPTRLGSNQSEVAQFIGAVTQGVGYFLLTTAIIVMLVLDGPILARRLRQLVPAENLGRTNHIGHIVYDVVARYFAGSILIGTLQGLWVLVTGLVLDVPLTPLLAVWAGLTALLPQIGGALGGIVVVAVALTQGLTTALIMGGLFVAYMTFSNNVLLPVLVGRAINVSPPTTMLAAIGGFAVGGIVGAIFAMPVVGAIKAVYLDLRGETPPSADEPGTGAGPSVLTRLRRRFGHASDDDDVEVTPAVS